MSEQENVRVVQEVFAAFGRGDLQAMLGLVGESVEWDIEGPEVVPYFGAWRGRDGVRDFVTRLATSVEFERFEPREFLPSGQKVVVTGSERGRVRATGKTFDNDWVIVFTLDGGRVSGCRIYDNTAAVAEAFRA